MIKKLILAVCIMAASLSVNAQELKVDNVSYVVLPDGSVEIMEAKKASGDYTIPSTITVPKSNKEYKVTSIGAQAFKKAKITSVKIPNSITSIGNEAFLECKQLTSVTIPESVTKLGNYLFSKCEKLTNAEFPKSINYIPEGCFSDCKSLTSMTIPASVDKIEDRAFWACGNLNKLVISESMTPLEFGTSVLYYVPLKDVVVARPILYTGSKENILVNSNRPFCNNPALESATIISCGFNGDPNLFTNLFIGCTGLKNMELIRPVISTGDFAELLAQIPKSVKITLNGEALTDSRETEVAYFRSKATFPKRWEQYIYTAYNDPANISNSYAEIQPWEFVVNIDQVKPDIFKVIDDYMNKDSLNKDQISLLRGLINNCFHFIGIDYKITNMDLEAWARHDILKHDIKIDGHKEDYEHIINVIEFLFLHSDIKEDPYHQAMQLAALCGLEKWAEAARYYPKVLQAVTDNGRYMIPTELTYMKEAIAQHGYKVGAPAAKKASSKASSNKSKNSGNDGLIEFFTDRAIKGVVNHYEKKRAEKREQKRQEAELQRLNDKAAKKKR